MKMRTTGPTGLTELRNKRKNIITRIFCIVFLVIFMIIPMVLGLLNAVGVIYSFFVEPMVVLKAAGIGALFLGAFSLICFSLYSIKRTFDRKKVFTARDELNEAFRAAGSPAFYECSYTDWSGVEEYDLDPAEEAVKFMKETKEKFERYIASGGDPERIRSVADL